MYPFPRNPILRLRWTKQIERTHSLWEPSEYLVLCSDHFAPDSFEPRADTTAKLGLKMKRRLKLGAVPDIFYRASTVGHVGSSLPRKRKTDACGEEPSTGNKRSAFEKRERFWVSTYLRLQL